MALRNIVTEGDSVLTKVSRPVTKFDRRLHVLLDDMTDTLVDAGGVGLAAPQVGVLRRAVVVDTGEDGILELINPEIIEESGEQTGLEGCLSVPGKYGIVTRPNYVKVRAQDRDGNWFEAEGEELIARCFCHELAHLEGQLYTAVAERMLTPDELKATMEEHEDQRDPCLWARRTSPERVWRPFTTPGMRLPASIPKSIRRRTGA